MGGFLSGLFGGDDPPPPAPNMAPIINAAQDISSMSKDLATQSYDWAKNAVANNQGNVDKLVNNITSDSDVSRGMIQNYQDISSKALGVANNADSIRQAAVGNAQFQQGVEQTQLGIQQDQLGWAKQLQQQQAGQLDIQGQFRQDQTAQQQKADALYGQYSQSYAPAMARYLADTEAYGSPERIAQAKAEAGADVSSQFQGARDAATRQLESFGVKPTDTRFAALDLGTRIQEAQAKVQAQQAAQRQMEQQAFALRQGAIAQGQQLPGQSTAATNAATSIGSNVVGQGNVATGAANAANTAGSVANAAGSNAVGAGNAATSGYNAATGATNATTGALQGATQAQSGALAANTAASNQDVAAGNLGTQALGTEASALGVGSPYLNAATSATTGAGNIQNAAYKNQLDQWKAQNAQSSGLGALLGAAAGMAGNAIMPGVGGAIGSAIGSKITNAFGGGGGSQMGDTEFESNIIGAAEGGAIPATASPTGGRAVDDVPAQLTSGEFVIPRDVASWLGEKQLQQLIMKAQKEKANAQAKPAIGPGVAGPPAVVSRPGPAIGAGAPQ